jgi:predicted O-methyltransferase YrrM
MTAWSTTSARVRVLGGQVGAGLPRPAVGALAVALALRDSIEGARDARRLGREHPRLAATGSAAGDLRALYERYVAEVSSPEMAVSWESARYLRDLCEAVRPARVLDLGSGFSSLVLRRYAAAAGHPVSVVSVDDDAQWLERTRDFLAEHGHSGDGELRLWDDFAGAPGEPFDVVFHDLAYGERRETAMTTAVSALSARGVIVFDDAQHLGHRRAAQRVAHDAGLATYSLYRRTLDGIGRFALLAAS